MANDAVQSTGQFAKIVVTNIGKEMIAKSQNGQTLTFTRVALGDGQLAANEDILALTAIKNERLSAPIAQFEDKGNGMFAVQFRVSNQSVETGFWHREIGLMAKIDNGEEQLYAYTTAGNKASFLYDKTTPIEERIVNLNFVIGNAQNVEVIVNNSIIYPTVEQMETAIAAHNDSTASHKDFVGATTTANGTRGMVPAPGKGANDRFLCADGSFKKAAMTTLEIVNIMYPVGMIVEFAANVDPNTVWAGTTWEQMDAGRVLISAGTYTEGDQTYTYALGDKGGEAKHQLTVEE
uniref:phage tail-collar fiber domain-containing protein n=1 Tax=uncultured Megasphaera sp. TaxID=165188 RepID=UPI0026596180